MFILFVLSLANLIIVNNFAKLFCLKFKKNYKDNHLCLFIF